jgi:hypothetical protein
VRLARRSRLSALGLLIFGLVMSILGMALSPSRRTTLFHFGVTLAVIGLLLRLIVRFGGAALAGVPWIHPAFEVMQETPYSFHDPSEFSCRPNRGGRSGSLLLLNHWIETAPAPLPSNAEKVNAYDFLLNRARRCQKERGKLPNLVAVDFYHTGDLFAVIETLNGIRGSDASAVPST